MNTSVRYQRKQRNLTQLNPSKLDGLLMSLHINVISNSFKKSSTAFVFFIIFTQTNRVVIISLPSFLFYSNNIQGALFVEDIIRGNAGMQPKI